MADDSVTEASGTSQAPGQSWLALQRLWESVVTSEKRVASRSGRWDVRKEYNGDGLGPIAGDFDEVAIYETRWGEYGKTEVGRWPLEKVVESDTAPSETDRKPTE